MPWRSAASLVAIQFGMALTGLAIATVTIAAILESQ